MEDNERAELMRELERQEKLMRQSMGSDMKATQAVCIEISRLRAILKDDGRMIDHFAACLLAPLSVSSKPKKAKRIKH